MSDESSPHQPVTPPPEPSLGEAAERAFWHRLWDMKKLTLWLAGPSAVLVFLNQLVPFVNLIKPGLDKPTVIVERHLPADLQAEENDDSKRPALFVEGTRFDDQSPQTLEFICRNRLQHPIFVQQANVEVLRIWKLQPALKSRGMLERSADYDVLLPAEGAAPIHLEKSLSQEIPANGLDRFALKLGLAPAKDASARVYHFRVSFACGSQTVSAGEFLCMISAQGSSPPPAGMNAKAIAEISSTSGTRNGPLDQFLAAARR